MPLRTHAGWLALLTACAGLLPGCVERRMIITSDPPGAVVYDENGMPLGAAPVDKPFVYYGKYRFMLVKDGSDTQIVEEQVSAPWYEWIGLDFFAENIIPFTIRDIRRFHYQLQPKQVIPPEEVLQQADVLRTRGRTVGVPLDPVAGTAGPASSPLMPAVP